MAVADAELGEHLDRGRAFDAFGEVDVLQRATRGDSNRRIAADLGLSRSTVRDAFENAQRKLGIARAAR